MFLAHYRLPDGTPLLFRHIRPDDKGRLAAGLARLSLDTQHKRFLMPKPRFSSSELRYLTEIDGFDHVAIVAVLADDAEAIVAVARFVRHSAAPDAAEVAIVVGDPYQGRGLGREIGRRLAEEARGRGVRRFTATLLGDNEAAHRLFASISDHLTQHTHDGLREVEAELPAA